MIKYVLYFHFSFSYLSPFMIVNVKEKPFSKQSIFITSIFYSERRKIEKKNKYRFFKMSVEKC